MDSLNPNRKPWIVRPVDSTLSAGICLGLSPAGAVALCGVVSVVQAAYIVNLAAWELVKTLFS